MGRVEMSKRELSRVEILARVKGGQLRLVDAAVLMRVSHRQGKRRWKRYRAEGAAGLKHRRAGRRSNRAYAEEFRGRIIGLVREKYGGAVGERFGPTLAAEHLRSPGGGRGPCPPLRPERSPFGLAGLRSGPGPGEKQKQKTKEREKKQEPQKGDTSNELTKGTFLKSFDTYIVC